MSDASESVTNVYTELMPDVILDAVASLGLVPSGRLLALNSYENRVYQVELEDTSYIVVKFYRGGRWSDATIIEEHEFTAELVAQEIPVVAPQAFAGNTLLRYQQYRFTVYPRRGGRTPELDNHEHLEQLGRVLGRIHATGQRKKFLHRPTLDVTTYGVSAVDAIVHSGFVPDYLLQNYQDITRRLLEQLAENFARIDAPMIRLHGDCHPGNMLWDRHGPFFVDLDDCCMGPQLQDIWMMLSGTAEEMSAQLRVIVQGYEMFNEFDDRQLPLLESLRALRLLHYSGWLTRRWSDPAFPFHFPWFNTPRYWEEQLHVLREQYEIIQRAIVLKL